VERLEAINYLRPSNWNCSKDGHVPLVCDLQEKASLIETLVGGKGLSLALLKSLDDSRVRSEILLLLFNKRLILLFCSFRYLVGSV